MSQHEGRRWGRRWPSLALATVFALWSALPWPVLAQGGAIDFEAPLVDIEMIDSGTRDAVQVFSATVTDNTAVETVIFHSRFASEGEYTAVPMERLNNSDFFSVNLPTEGTGAERVEYYVEAADEAGNTVLKGYSFEPFVRVLDPKPAPPVAAAPKPEPTPTPEPVAPSPDLTTADTSSAPAPVDEEAPESSKRGGINWWYVALGVIVAGAAASGGGGGGGGGGEPSGDDPDACCTVTLTAPQP